MDGRKDHLHGFQNIQVIEMNKTFDNPVEILGVAASRDGFYPEGPGRGPQPFNGIYLAVMAKQRKRLGADNRRQGIGGITTMTNRYHGVHIFIPEFGEDPCQHVRHTLYFKNNRVQAQRGDMNFRQLFFKVELQPKEPLPRDFPTPLRDNPGQLPEKRGLGPGTRPQFLIPGFPSALEQQITTVLFEYFTGPAHHLQGNLLR